MPLIIILSKIGHLSSTKNILINKKKDKLDENNEITPITCVKIFNLKMMLLYEGKQMEVVN